MKKHTILLVEDGDFNRSLLRKILENDYTIIEAGNGQEALDILNKNPSEISAIILDLVMPIMDGFTFIKIVRRDNAFKNIPILVTTVLDESYNELEVLKLGASDFIAKPFNPVVIKQRVANVISLHENAVLRNVLEKDELTNLYNTKMFCQITEGLIRTEKNTVFGIIVINIRDFQSINNSLGYKEGNALLIYLADIIRRESLLNQCVYGRLSADNFAVCMPFNKPFIDNYTKIVTKDLENYTNRININLHFGIYEITDTTMDVMTMCEMARLASKDKSTQELATYFTPEIAAEKEMNDELLDTMPSALDNKEFTMYFQPKYDMNNTISLLEAVIRWNHPVHGTLSPERFISLTEENCMSRQLDAFALDYVCAMLAKRITDGDTIIPICINLSRGDLYDPHLESNIAESLKTYDISANNLILECKEDIYMNDVEAFTHLIDIAKNLNIRIAIDNFGSLFGAINALLNLPISFVTLNLQTIKIPRDKIPSVINMLRMIDGCCITILGIETEEDLLFAKALNVDYLQGNYLSPALPYSELPNY